MDNQQVTSSIVFSTNLIPNQSRYMKPLTFILLIHFLAQFTTSDTKASQVKHTNNAPPIEDAFRDPIVWNTNSLYKLNKNPNSVSLTNRRKRSTNSQNQQSQFVDACQSKMEILTPYYATNSKGKLRTVVNSELMQQAIQVETCIR